MAFVKTKNKYLNINQNKFKYKPVNSFTVTTNVIHWSCQALVENQSVCDHKQNKRHIVHVNVKEENMEEKFWFLFNMTRKITKENSKESHLWTKFLYGILTENQVPY